MNPIKVASLCCFLFSNLIFAHCSHGEPTRNGLALAGGGALGFAHVGVLKVMHEARVPVDYVAGTSMGSIVGAAYASGASIEEIERIISDTDWEGLFGDGPPRSGVPYKDKTGRNREILGDGKFGITNGKLVVSAGILQGQKIRPVLQKLFYRYPEAGSFDQLAIKYRAVAADIETGLPVIISNGDLSLATRASMAVPGVFAPVEMNGHLLVDGGIANNLPINVVQDLGAKRVIAVELYADLAKRDVLTNPLAISGQMLSLLLSQNSAIQREHLTSHDILIEPNLVGYTATDFGKAKELIKVGEDAARAKFKELQRWSVSQEEYDKWEANRIRNPFKNDKIDFVQINNKSSIPDKVITERINVKPGDPFDPKAIDASVDNVYSIGSFSQVSSEVVKSEDGSQTGIQFSAKEKDWYQQYVRVGLSLEDDFNGDSFYNLGLGLRMNDVGQHGGYADISARLGRVSNLKGEWADPFSDGSNFFYGFDGFIDRRNLYVMQDDELFGEYERRRMQGGFKLGYGFYESWEAALGLRRGTGDIKKRVGDDSLNDSTFEVGDTYTRVVLDTLDDIDFPERGVLTRLGVSRSTEDLGATSNFTEYSGELTKPIPLGPINLIYKGEFSWTDSMRPAGRTFTLGGFLDLSGYTQNSLAASTYHIHKFSFLRELDSGSALLGYKLFAGASLELAALKSDLPRLPDQGTIAAGSLFIGANTPLLPVYIGYGLAEKGNQSVYLVIGRITSGAQRYEGG